MSKRAVIYTRVSRDDTGLGKSNDRQEAECRRLTDYKRLDVVAVESDISISAYSGKARPAWKRVLNMVRNGEVDYVIAYHMDRMTRSMLDLEELILLCEEHNVGIATAVGDIDLTSDMGRMVARILAAVARAEVERKSARQKLANAQRAAEGKPHVSGIRPFGYADDHLTLISEEADAIRDAARRALAGETMISIAKSWTEAGLISARARRGHDKGKRATVAGWSARGVRNVLISPRYAGIRTYNGEPVGEGDWEPVLDRETHLALVDMLGDPARRKGAVKKGRRPSSLLTALALCEVCDAPVRASAIRGRQTYTCRAGHGHADRAVADAEVSAATIALLASPDWMALIVPSGDERVDEAKAEVDDLKLKLKTYAQLLADDVMDVEQFTQATATARAKLKGAEELLARAGMGPMFVGLDLGTPAVAGQWEGLGLDRQRAIVQGLLSVKVRRKAKGMSLEDQVAIEPRYVAA
ncbi:serine integrase [Streptomyces phage phiScoe25]|nr:serine integrase [Streptomyces phage phiScoe25]